MSVENYLPWAFRLVVLGLVAWTAFCILRKVLRRAGVLTYPPFKSRAEYLEAALEMNLEDFIGRAKVTPRSLIQKPPAPDLKIKMADPESIFQTIDSMIHTFSRGLEEVVALKKIEAAPPEQVKWLRLKESGALVRFSLRAQEGEFRTCEISEGKNRLVTFHRADLESAYPRRGEWWQKHVCHVPHNSPNMETAWISGVVQWHYSTNAACESHGPEIMAAQCGCLTPVNFGKGEEQKSGVA